MTPQDVIAKLSEFETPAEIRRLFGDLGIKAMRGQGRYCAIAEYAFRESGERPRVSLTCGFFADTQDGAFFEWAHTKAMEDFVGDFDAGMYPELER